MTFLLAVLAVFSAYGAESGDSSAFPFAPISPLASITQLFPPIMLDSPVYSVEDMVTINITLSPAEQGLYSLVIRSGSRDYSYKGSFNPVMFFYPTEEDIYTAALVEKSTGATYYSVSFNVTGSVPSLPDEASLPIGTGVLATDKREYLQGELAVINIAGDLDGLQLHHAYAGTSQRYMGALSRQIAFRPSGLGEHLLLLYNSQGFLVDNVTFRMVATLSGNNPETSSVALSAVSAMPASDPAAVYPDSSQGPFQMPGGDTYLVGDPQDPSRETRRMVLSPESEETSVPLLPPERSSDQRYQVELDKPTGFFKRVMLRQVRLNESALSLPPQAGYEYLGMRMEAVAPSQAVIGMRKALKAYAIDPASLEFINGTATSNAVGDELWKCRSWDYDLQTCNGVWVKVMDLTPGQDYTIQIDPYDPAYAETGVASINTNKSTYHPGEPVRVYIVVLDDQGRLTRGADVTLEITDPLNRQTVFSSSASSSRLMQTGKGVYEAEFISTSVQGDYSMLVSASGANVNSTMLSTFAVRSSYPFDIIRKAPIVTDPWDGSFISEIAVDAFIPVSEFTLTERLPEDFEITDPGTAVVSYSNGSVRLTWSGLSDGDRVMYEARPPLRSPELYALGPAQISYTEGASEDMYEEARPWFLAVDPDTNFKMEIHTYTDINETWKTKNFTYSYSSPIVVITPSPNSAWASNDPPFGANIRSVTGSSVQIRITVPERGSGTGLMPSDNTVYMLVMEEGFWNASNSKINFTVEGMRFTSNTAMYASYTTSIISSNAASVDLNSSWGTIPKIYMATASINNDDSWIAVHSFESTTRQNPPTQTQLTAIRMGMSSCEVDPSDSHPAEEIHLVVFQDGLFNFSGLRIRGFRTTDTVEDYGHSTSDVTHGMGAAPAWGVTMQVAEDGGNGAWGQWKIDPFQSTYLEMYAQEDRYQDSETSHTAEEFEVIIANSSDWSYQDMTAFTASASMDSNLINPGETVKVTGNCTVTDTIVPAVNAYILLQDNSSGSWQTTPTSDSDVYANVSSYYLGYMTTGSSSANYSFNITGLAPGDYAFRLVCNASNAVDTPSSSYNLRVNRAPNVTLMLPVDTANLSYGTGIDFNFTTNDDESPVYNCTLWGNFSGTWSANQSAYNVSIDTEANITIDLADAWYLWSVKCEDNHSLSNFSAANRTLLVDTTVPAIDYFYFTAADDSYYSRDWIYVDVEVTEANEKNITFRLYNTTGPVNISSFTTAVRSVNFTGLDPDMEYWYNVTVCDQVGWCNTTETRKLTLDGTAPIISYNTSTEANNTYFNRDWIFINVTVLEDNEKNITFVLYNATHTLNFSNYTTPVRSVNFTNLNSNMEYWYYVKVFDEVDLSDTTEIRKITLDSTLPNVTLHLPQNDSFVNNGSVIFYYNLTETNGDTCILYGNFSGPFTQNETNSSPSQGTNAFVPVSLTDDAYIWNVWCNDSANNSAFYRYNYTVKVDTQDPVTTNWSANGTEFLINQYICLNVTTTDSFSGLEYVYAEIENPNSETANITLMDDGLGCDISAGDDVYSVEYLLQFAGNFTWYSVNVKDYADNWEINATDIRWNVTTAGSMSVNMTSPLTDLEINESEYSNTYQQTCNVSCDSDSLEECANVTLFAQYDPLVFTDVNTTTTALVNAEDSYPCGNLTPGGASCAHTFDITSGPYSGNNTWKIRCKAWSLNFGAYVSSEVNLMVNDHPTAQFYYPTGGTWLTGVEVINVSTSYDSDGNITRYIYEYDDDSAFGSPSLICDTNQSNCTWNTPAQDQCTNNTMDCYLRVNVTDDNDLTNITYIIIGFDTQGPVVSLDRPRDYENITANLFTVNATASDSESGVERVYFEYRISPIETWQPACNDTTSPYSCIWNLTLLSDLDTYEFRAYAADNKGNLGPSDNHTNIKVDRTGPVVSLQTPVNEANLTYQFVTFYYQVNDALSGVLNCTLYVDSVPRNTSSTITEGELMNFTYNFTSDDTYSWYVSCIDEFSNTDWSSARSINIDTQPPVSTLDLPSNYAVITGTSYMVNASVSDSGPAGIDTAVFEYRINSTASWLEICNDSDGSPYNCTWNISGLTERDTYEVRVRSNDTWSRWSNNDTHTNITIDQSPPNITLIAPDEGVQDADGDIVFVYQVNDTSSIQNCSLILNGTLNQTSYSVPRGSNQQFTLDDLPDQIAWNWSIRCYDSVPFTSISETRNLTVNLTDALNVNVTTDKSSYGVGETVQISSKVTDDYGNGQNGANIYTDIILGATNHSWWNTAWARRIAITLNGSLVPSNQTDFVIAVQLNSSNFNFSNAKSDGSDVRFINRQLAELSYEIEEWNATSQTATIWVEVANLTSGEDTVVHLYYNNSAASTNQNPITTFSNGYRAVWHLNESTGTEYDATSYSNDGTPTFTSPGTQDARGLFDGADTFDGTGDLIGPLAGASTGMLDAHTTHTIEGWVNRSTDDTMQVIWVEGGTTVGFGLYLSDGAGTPQVTHFVRTSTGSAYDRVDYALSNINAGQWYYIVGVWDGPGGMLYLYVNGVNVTQKTTTTTSVSNPGNGWRIGGHNGQSEPISGSTNYYLTATLDEVRVSTTARSQDWVSISYASMSGQLARYGDEEIWIQRTFGSTDPLGLAYWNWSSTGQDYGNYSAVSYATITGFNPGQGGNQFELRPDWDGPMITLYAPEDEHNSTNQTITFSYSVFDAANNVSNCSLVIDGSIVNTTDDPTEDTLFNFNYTFADGYHNWTINCSDTLNNTNASELRNLSIDSTGPIAALDRPQNDTVINAVSQGFYTVNASVSDPGPAAINEVFFYYRYNSTESWNFICNDSDGAAPFNCTWDLTGLETGYDYEVRVYANDTFGNTGDNDTHVNITLVTEAINITYVLLEDNTTLPLDELDLVAGGIKQIDCNVTAQDPMVYTDIAGVNATLYYLGSNSSAEDDNRTHYTNSSCAFVTGGGDSADYLCSFQVLYYAINGTWICNASARNAYTEDYEWDNSTMNQLYALNVSSSVIDYAEMAPEEVSSNMSVNITNMGNIPINISVYGFGGEDEASGTNLAMTCEINNITASFQRFSTTLVPYTSKTSLSSTPQDLGITIPAQANASETSFNTTYWQLMVPASSYSFGQCNGSIVFSATTS